MDRSSLQDAIQRNKKKMQKQKEQAMQELMTMQGNENGFGGPAPNNGGDE